VFCPAGRPRALIEALEALAAEPQALEALRARVAAVRSRFTSAAQAQAFADHLDARLGGGG